MQRNAERFESCGTRRGIAIVVTLFASVIFAVLGFARSAAAKSDGIQVLALYSEDANDQAHALTVALKNAIRHSGKYDLDEGDYSLEVLALALGCSQPPDAGCQDSIAKKIGSNRYIWGTMSLSGNDVVTDLYLWESGSVARQTRLKYTANLTTAADDLLRLIASRATNELFAGTPSKGARRGLLVVTAGTVNGLVFVDDEPAGPIRNGYAELMVRVGRRRIAVEAHGYERSHGSVIVHGDGPSDIALQPERIHEDNFASESYGDTRDRDGEEDEGASRKSTAGAWAAVGAGALMVGGGVYSAIQVRKIDQDAGYARYRAGLHPDQNACVEASRGTQVPGASPASDVSRLCDRSRTFEALQYVLFGLGTVSAGAGVIMLLSGGDDGVKEERSARVQPTVNVGPTGARVQLSLTF